MLLKKIIPVFIAVLIMCCMLSACSASFKDGTYRAEAKDFDSHGWKDYVEIIVKDGKITSVDYDSMNKDGDLKSQDESYRESMEPISKTYPEKYMKELEEQLLSKQDAAKIDNVTGATTSSDSFKKLASQLIKTKINKGDSSTLIFDTSN